MPISTSWRRLLAAAAPEAKFSAPGIEENLLSVEQALGVVLPQELRKLLLEFDGATADYGADVIWSSAEICRRNLAFCQLEGFREL